MARDDDGQGGDASSRRNLLRLRLWLAAQVAEGSLSTLEASRTNPLAAQIDILESAWIADGSQTRPNFVADVRGAGEGVRRSFAAAHDDLLAASEREESWIDVQAHPEREWKTWPDRINAHIGMGYPGGYR